MGRRVTRDQRRSLVPVLRSMARAVVATSGMETATSRGHGCGRARTAAVSGSRSGSGSHNRRQTASALAGSAASRSRRRPACFSPRARADPRKRSPARTEFRAFSPFGSGRSARLADMHFVKNGPPPSGARRVRGGQPPSPVRAGGLLHQPSLQCPRDVHGRQSVHRAQDDRVGRHRDMAGPGKAKVTLANTATDGSLLQHQWAGHHRVSSGRLVQRQRRRAESTLDYSRELGELPSRPTISYTTGHVTFTVAPNGQTTSYSLAGGSRQTDVCAVLAP